MSMYRYEPADGDTFGQIHSFLRVCPHGVVPPSVQAVFDWCREQFGEDDVAGRWSAQMATGTVWLREENDAFAFRMRWC